MKPVRYNAHLSMQLDPHMRAVIQKMAEEEMMSLGEVARSLIDAGMKARGIAT